MGEGFETLLVEDHGQHVRVVTLNRPEARNALNIQMGNDVVRFFEGIAADPGELRCPVLPARATGRSVPAAT